MTDEFQLQTLGRTYASACTAESDFMIVDYIGECHPPTDEDLKKVGRNAILLELRVDEKYHRWFDLYT